MVLTSLLVLDFMTEELPLDVGFRYDPGFAVLTGVLSLAYPAVGALIASRLPANPIGWIFCGTGLIYAMRRSTTAYADYAFIEPSALPWGEVSAWLSTWWASPRAPPGGVPSPVVSRRLVAFSSVADLAVGDGRGSSNDRGRACLHARYPDHPRVSR